MVTPPIHTDSEGLYGRWLVCIREFHGICTADQERLASDVGVRRDEVVRETRVEGMDALQVFDLRWSKFDAQRLDVVLEVLDFAATNNRENIGCLGQDVGEGDRCDRLGAVLGSNFGQRLAYLDFIRILMGRLSCEAAKRLA